MENPAPLHSRCVSHAPPMRLAKPLLNLTRPLPGPSLAGTRGHSRDPGWPARNASLQAADDQNGNSCKTLSLHHRHGMAAVCRLRNLIPSFRLGGVKLGIEREAAIEGTQCCGATFASLSDAGVGDRDPAGRAVAECRFANCRWFGKRPSATHSPHSAGPNKPVLHESTRSVSLHRRSSRQHVARFVLQTFVGYALPRARQAHSTTQLRCRLPTHSLFSYRHVSRRLVCSAGLGSQASRCHESTTTMTRLGSARSNPRAAAHPPAGNRRRSADGSRAPVRHACMQQDQNDQEMVSSTPAATDFPSQHKKRK